MRAKRAGSAAASGGCTDAGVRLGGLLSVRHVHLPAQPRGSTMYTGRSVFTIHMARCHQ